VGKVWKLVCSDRWLNAQVMAEELNLDRETVRKIWEWGKFQQRWCHEFCLITRNSGGLMFVLISLVSWPKETTF
jgi:hypothetical protein